MLSRITGFRLDEQGHWIADLSCGHARHMRHRPPLVERPWVLTPEGRAARMDTKIECELCRRAPKPAPESC